MKQRSFAFSIIIGGCFVALMSLFAAGLNNNPNQLDLATQGQRIPSFSLPDLLHEKYMIKDSDLVTEKPFYLLNIWGSWCPECHQEHAYLMTLGKTVPIYGVSWQDKRADALRFLRVGGNPYQSVIVDAHSELAIGLGVYGAPETFLLDKDGTILFRHVGAMNADVWTSDFLPLIEALK